MLKMHGHMNMKCVLGVCRWITPAILDISLFAKWVLFWSCPWIENRVTVLDMSVLLGQIFLGYVSMV